ncbi:Putative membrane peptidase family [Melghirimyces algeriensis]|uniref:Membrane peptidase family n=1 Tax=Melghirimyces algeriensis TaxID=910412 RepID=A0A521DDP8_9BACL|nr:YhfC family glutamic-type intramembrane protease [Melghirimyces algeriensis]SMO69773.1 Putative membrane peptidase family [Melghirimyces algeriensis]
MVSSWSVFFMILTLMLSLTFPIIVLSYLYKKKQVSLKPILIGAAIFVIFSQSIERILNLYILQTTEWFNNPYLYAIYGGLAAGLFEESGRFLGFRYLLKNHRGWKDGLSYGIGHGGIDLF